MIAQKILQMLILRAMIKNKIITKSYREFENLTDWQQRMAADLAPTLLGLAENEHLKESMGDRFKDL